MWHFPSILESEDETPSPTLIANRNMSCALSIEIPDDVSTICAG